MTKLVSDMSDAAIVSGQVVDIQNDMRHKGFIKITVHVPEEARHLVSAAFSIPSYSSPVPVALARLKEEAVAQKPPPSHRPQDSPAGERKPLTLPQTIAMLCKDPDFQRFVDAETEAEAADSVRHYCAVKTRASILMGTVEGDLFQELYDKFNKWRIEHANEFQQKNQA